MIGGVTVSGWIAFIMLVLVQIYWILYLGRRLAALVNAARSTPHRQRSHPPVQRRQSI
jgi:hypothetical protein